MSKSLLQIGASKEAVEAARKAVLDIMASDNDQATIQKALDVFKDLCEVKNATITNCTFSSGQSSDAIKVRK